jgi:hypothetical protein
MFYTMMQCVRSLQVRGSRSKRLRTRENLEHDLSTQPLSPQNAGLELEQRYRGAVHTLARYSKYLLSVSG